MYDLSILIPARNEEWLAETVKDILKNKRGKTQVIVGLDGQWADPPVEDHPDVVVVYYPESIGQRAMTNQLCKLSTAKYVAKCDAHTCYDEGFDVKLMEAVKGHDDWTIVPEMRNLHAFDWECVDCGMRTYQGPEPEYCRSETCQEFDENNVIVDKPNKFKKVTVFKPRERTPHSTAYRFNKNLQFKYFNELKRYQEPKGVVETMSLQGSFFMLTREKYWELNICDETWGSWGQQGTEVALKTWLSGGRVVCLRDTWYAHLFRTQRGFGFPYPNSGKDQQRARQISQDIFLKDKWPQAIKPLNWLLAKFWFALKEVTDEEARWEEKDISFEDQPTRDMIFFTDNQLTLKIAHKVQNQLKKIAAQKNMGIISASLKPMDFGDNVVVKGERGYETYFKQILAALEKSRAEYVYFVEHDVLYPPEHFDFIPPDDKFYYDHNWVKAEWIDGEFTGRAVSWEADQVSGLVCKRETALAHYQDIVKNFNPKTFKRSFEPQGGESFKSAEPYLDIRQGNNLTKSKWSLADFRDKSSAKNFKETNVPEWTKGIINWQTQK